MRAGEEGLKFHLLVITLEEVKHVVGFVESGLILGLGAELVHGFDVIEFLFDGQKRLDGSAEALHFLDDFLRGFLEIPELRRVHFFFEGFDLGLLGRDVKESRGWFSSAP